MQIRVEADGGSRGNPGPAAAGAVLFDQVTGEKIVELAKYCNIATNNYAEYTAAIIAIEYLKENYPSAKITVYMDSNLVVKQLSGEWKIKHPDMQKLAIKANSIMKDMSVVFKWIPREQNTKADQLVNECLDNQQDILRKVF